MNDYRLNVVDKDGNESYLVYNPHSSKLTYPDGRNVVDVKLLKYDSVYFIAPSTPGYKSHDIRTVKIQLGLTCNYKCSYCSQAEHVENAAETSSEDVREFLEQLPKWLHTESIEEIRFEFWGGEPLLYWKKIEALLPVLKRRYPFCTFLIITNGSLLTQEIIDVIAKYDVGVGISHDGPGQGLRGKDPLAVPSKLALIKNFMLTRRGRVSINSVLTKKNPDPVETMHWFQKAFDMPNITDITVIFEGVVNIYHDEAKTTQDFSQADYNYLRESVADGIIEGTLLKSSTFRNMVDYFIDGLKTARPSVTLGQKCGMDRSDRISVDLKGNVMTCQNTGAKGKHGIGTVAEFDKIRLNTSTHWAHREECNNCPVLQLCRGACMYLEGDNWYHTCQNEYYYKSGVLAGAIYVLTGLKLVSIEGKIVRPKKPKTIIPITVTT